MLRSPYSRFAKRDLTLNDYLAIDRTVLANERTLLSYGRTSLALLILGGSCLKFFEELWIQAAGVAFIVLATFMMERGWRRYRRMKHLLSAALEQMTGASKHPLEEGTSREKEAAKEAHAKETAAKNTEAVAVKPPQ